MTGRFRRVLTAVAAVLSAWGISFAAGCSEPAVVAEPNPTPQQQAASTARGACESGNAGLIVPAGFCASIFADNIGHARHLVVATNGTVYVNTSSNKQTKFENAPGGYLVALRDVDGDGRAEIVERFGTVHQPGKPGGGTGIALHNALYVEVNGRIVRYHLTPDRPVPAGPPETIVSGMPTEGDHGAHPFTISESGVLYVNSGSASNSCQEKNRTLKSPGQKPCPELPTRAGIWRYDANKTGQAFSPAARFATGMRNTVGLATYPGSDILYAAVHGRDQLSENWPALYTEAQNNELPAETLIRVDQGEDHGWPSCYFDGAQKKYVLAPEYGGDGGQAVGDCAKLQMPEVTFPAHWAPEAVAFVSGSSWPAKYQGGALVSFHGSWNRKPAQAGFLVAFVPFTGDKPAGTYEQFAIGFSGATPPADPLMAPHRPMGLAIGSDGSLYVSDDVKGRIWRITPAADTTR